MSQLNFFLFPNEIYDRLKAIVDNTDTLVFADRIFEEEYPKPFEVNKNISIPDQLTLWLKNEHKSHQGRIITEGINQGRFTFHSYKDPVIEFINCKTKQTILSPGRIYYKAGWIDNELLRSAHKKWATKTTRIIGKNLRRLNKYWYISNAVSDWVNEGGSLELGPGGMIINKENINIY